MSAFMSSTAAQPLCRPSLPPPTPCSLYAPTNTSSRNAKMARTSQKTRVQPERAGRARRNIVDDATSSGDSGSEYRESTSPSPSPTPDHTEDNAASSPTARANNGGATRRRTSSARIQRPKPQGRAKAPISAVNPYEYLPNVPEYGRYAGMLRYRAAAVWCKINVARVRTYRKVKMAKPSTRSTCVACGGDVTMTESELNRHYFAHLPRHLRPFPCPFEDCSSRFAQRRQRETHFLVHFKEIPVEDRTYCGVVDKKTGETCTWWNKDPARVSSHKNKCHKGRKSMTSAEFEALGGHKKLRPKKNLKREEDGEIWVEPWDGLMDDGWGLFGRGEDDAGVAGRAKDVDDLIATVDAMVVDPLLEGVLQGRVQVPVQDVGDEEVDELAGGDDEDGEDDDDDLSMDATISAGPSGTGSSRQAGSSTTASSGSNADGSTPPTSVELDERAVPPPQSFEVMARHECSHHAPLYSWPPPPPPPPPPETGPSAPSSTTWPHGTLPSVPESPSRRFPSRAARYHPYAAAPSPAPYTDHLVNYGRAPRLPPKPHPEQSYYHLHALSAHPQDRWQDESSVSAPALVPEAGVSYGGPYHGEYRPRSWEATDHPYLRTHEANPSGGYRGEHRQWTGRPYVHRPGSPYSLPAASPAEHPRVLEPLPSAEWSHASSQGYVERQFSYDPLMPYGYSYTPPASGSSVTPYGPRQEPTGLSANGRDHYGAPYDDSERYSTPYEDVGRAINPYGAPNPPEYWRPYPPTSIPPPPQPPAPAATWAYPTSAVEGTGSHETRIAHRKLTPAEQIGVDSLLAIGRCPRVYGLSQ